MSSIVQHRDRSVRGADTAPLPPAAALKRQFPTTLAGLKQQTPLQSYGRILLAAMVVVVVVLIWTSSPPPGESLEEVTAAPKRQGRASARPRASSGKVGEPVSPRQSVVFPPFKDLCEWITGRRTLSVAATAAMPATAIAPDPELRAQLESAMDRFDHIAADGGAAGRRWSAATGLPLASQRTGDVKVRFVAVTNRVDGTTHFATVAAAMAGVRLDMLGKDWKGFSFTKRTRLLVSYAEREGLTDADVIVATDADAVMSGEDAESFFAAFVASTAASEEEHMTYSVRDIRTGKRQTPIIFSAEATCWAFNTFRGSGCVPGYQRIYDMRERWVTSSNESLQRNFNKHAFKYLNAGVMVARVWALRELETVFHSFALTHRPRRKWRQWHCDQSAFAALHLDLLWWELESHAWDGVPEALPAAKWKKSLYPPQSLPSPGRGPHNLPPGLIGIDQFTRLSLTIEPSLNRKNAYGFGGNAVRYISKPERSVSAAVARDASVETSSMGLTRTRHRLAMTPRNYVDCTGVSSAPPECAYRDAVWGIPANASAVVPLLWHFSGGGKSDRFAHYRTVFPWYTPTLKDSAALQRLVRVYANLPPTRVFAIDPETNNNVYMSVTRVLPHRTSDDVTSADVCRASVLRSTG
jgi:hypothetical protein